MELLLPPLPSQNNAASYQGGAWSLERQGKLLLSNSTFENNSAKFGGGLSAGRYFSLYVSQSSNFTGNQAKDHAGAIECDGCDYVRIDGSRFEGEHIVRACIHILGR